MSVHRVLAASICLLSFSMSVSAQERLLSLPWVALGSAPPHIQVEEQPASQEAIHEIIDEFEWWDISGEELDTHFLRRGDFIQTLAEGKLEGSDSPVVKLLRLGPIAIPALLERIRDFTPTKTEIDMTGGGKICFREFVYGNVANPTERSALGLRDKCFETEPDSGRLLEIDGGKYTLLIGDVCYTVLGMIVGRDYTSIAIEFDVMYVHSPVKSAKLARQIRSIWSTEKPTQLAMESWLYDTCCRGINQNAGLDRWDEGSIIQVQAYVRLLYYFPDQAAPLIVERIEGFVTRSRSLEECIANGIIYRDLFVTLEWTKDKSVLEAMNRFRDRKGENREDTGNGE